jgi:hypothetical protein
MRNNNKGIFPKINRLTAKKRDSIDDETKF